MWPECPCSCSGEFGSIGPWRPKGPAVTISDRRRRPLGLLLIGSIGMAGQAVPARAAQKKTAVSAGGGAVTTTASRQDQSPPLTSIAPAPDGKKRGHAARTRHGQ